MVAESDRARVLRCLGLGAIAWSALTRATTDGARVPHWDSHPAAGVVEATLTPALALGLDSVVLLGAAIIFLAETAARRPILWRSGLLVLAGTMGVLLHGLVLPPFGNATAPADLVLRGDARSLDIGGAWISAVVGAWAALHAFRDPLLRRACLAVLAGFAAPLFLKGLQQVVIEIPAMVTEFEENREAILIRNGFQPGSPEAEIFERRLRGGDATGWFHLGNVYGSMAAALTVLLGGVALDAFRSRGQRLPIGPRAVLAGGALAAVVALCLSRSRGAGLALLPGLALAAVLIRWPGFAGRARLRALLIGLPALALVAVAARGFAGTQLAERSLLFRSHYLAGAARIASEHPLLGVGPASFKAAYGVAKVPTSPEVVESPHSVVFDWTACLGLLGLAWVLAFVLWLLRPPGTSDQPPFDPDAPMPGRNSVPGMRWIVAVIAAVTLSGIIVSWGLAVQVPIELGGRIIAGVLWIALAGVVAVVLPTARLGASAGSIGALLVLLLHAQIDVAPVLRSSAPLVGLLVAIGIAGLPAREPRPSPARSPGVVVGALSVGIAGVVALAGALPATRWEGHLATAARLASEPALRPDRAAAELDRAARIRPAQHAVARERMRQLVEAGRLEDAVRVADGLERRWPRSVQVQVAVAGFWLALPRLGGDAAARRAGAADRAVGAARAAVEAEPWGLTPALLLHEALRAAGDRDAARAAASRVLEVDRALALDPAARLPAALRRELERRAGTAASQDSG